MALLPKPGPPGAGFTFPPCPFCHRPTIHLMVHHLIPREFGGGPTIRSCRDCHKAIHTLFTNRELAQHYHTHERLMAHEEFAKMIAYIAKQDPAGKVKFRRPRSRRRRS